MNRMNYGAKNLQITVNFYFTAHQYYLVASPLSLALKLGTGVTTPLAPPPHRTTPGTACSIRRTTIT